MHTKANEEIFIHETSWANARPPPKWKRIECAERHSTSKRARTLLVNVKLNDGISGSYTLRSSNSWCARAPSLFLLHFVFFFFILGENKWNWCLTFSSRARNSHIGIAEPEHTVTSVTNTQIEIKLIIFAPRVSHVHTHNRTREHHVFTTFIYVLIFCSIK